MEKSVWIIPQIPDQVRNGLGVPLRIEKKTGLTDESVSPVLYTGISEIEIPCCVVVGNILDHLVQERHLALRKPALLDILPYHAA